MNDSETLNDVRSPPDGELFLYGGWVGWFEEPEHDEYMCAWCGDYIEQRAFMLAPREIDSPPSDGDCYCFHSRSHARKWLRLLNPDYLIEEIPLAVR